MLFNSIDFLVFFPVVCTVYFSLPSIRLRNIFLLAACYWFYASWQPVYLLLLVAATMVTYSSAILACRFRNHRKTIITSGIAADLAMLFFFKYFNFAGELLGSILSASGLRLDIPHLEILLPVGISFYIFQAIGYLADVAGDLNNPLLRNGKTVERNLLRFALFMSFFPQLVAGPIERSRDLLPQFREMHRFSHDNFMAGLKLMLAGYFLKLVIADRCAIYVDTVWNNLADHNGGSCLLAAFLFSLQIYGDFAGYSLVAIGAAKIMGFRLSMNFNRPYLSGSVTEFWQRWHISLSRWMRDYVYIPLGGNRKGAVRTRINLMTTMLLSGLWHGADLSFIAWGGLHGGAMAIEKRHKGKTVNYRWLRITATFVFVTFAWIFFRAPDMSDAYDYIEKIFSEPGIPYLAIADFIAITAGLTVWELRRFRNERLRSWFAEHTLIAMSIAYIILFGVLDGSQFIYFAF